MKTFFLSIHSDIILIYKVGDNHRCLFFNGELLPCVKKVMHVTCVHF